MSHKLLSDCTEAGLMVKIPLLVLSGWSKWNAALKNETKVKPSRITPFSIFFPLKKGSAQIEFPP
jgi:hypothetical protein